MSKDDVDEQVGPLDAPLEQVRVIEQEDAKLFVCRGVVLTKKALEVMGAMARDFNELTNGFSFENPIPVLGIGHTERIGAASVFWEGDALIAEVSIPYASEERLLIETMDVYAESTVLIPGPGGEAPLVLSGLWLTTGKPDDSDETPLRALVVD